MGTHCIKWRPSSTKRGHISPHFSAHVLWPNGWVGQDATGTEVGLGPSAPGHIVLDGDRASLPRWKLGFRKGHSSPARTFRSILWPNGWMHQDTTLYRGRPRPKRHCVKWGHSPHGNGQSKPDLSAHVCCGQTAVCIRIPHGTKVGLVPRDIVLDGDTVPATERSTAAREFSAHCSGTVAHLSNC